MIPSAENSDYPRFVADQVLTSDNLNDLFGYLDEQNRLTRTNLVGIGIVCGLQVKTGTDTNGQFITITKGCGVTSAGYLVAVPELTYHHYNKFDAAKNTYYDKFVDISGDATATPPIPPHTQRFDLWELKQLGETADALNPFHNLNDPVNFLNSLVVLLFVELLEENNKNCNPDSCDDKGAKVSVNFRPLLVTKANAAGLIFSVSGNISPASFNILPDIFLQRWDVPNTSPVNAEQIISAYKAILTQNFIQSVQSALSDCYTIFQPIVKDDYGSSDPFTTFNLVNTFSFLYNGSINTSQAIQIQYYYDFFSDLVAAYNEFCITGTEIISTCCPDESLFPRHLLLGEAIPLAMDIPSAYRHYFVYAPLYQHKDLIIQLKSLFRRMHLMLKNFLIPQVSSSGTAASDDLKIKITPSKLYGAQLSSKAIPYYYTPNINPVPLFKHWSFKKSLRNRAHQILSYNSDAYNQTDDFVTKPLKYDLEPYNFLRIEGITGKQLSTVLNTIKNRIQISRLPFQVVAISTGAPSNGKEDDCCCLADIELQYQVLRKQLLCCLKGNIRYWGSIEKKDDANGAVTFLPGKADTKIASGLSVETITLEANEAVKVKREMLKKSQPISSKKFEAPAEIMVKGWFITEALPEANMESMAVEYLRYQEKVNIKIRDLPEPQTNASTENISYYILILIDELEELGNLLKDEDIAVLNEESFVSHADKLAEASSKLDKLLTGYHTTEYQVEKIKLNTPSSHSADVDRIAAAMPVIGDGDASTIILLLINLESTVEFIRQLQKNQGKYKAQQATISAFFKTLEKDGMQIPVTREPEREIENRYSVIRERLKTGMCSCDIDILKYLIKRYKEQKDQLLDVNNFSIYSKNHPGLQHKAGVTFGGTFVIVYKGSKDPKEDIPLNTVIADFYLPYTCSSDCTPIQVIVQEPPAPVNQPPIARAGEDISLQLPVDEILLDGTSSTDPDGTINTYLWAFKSGPPGALLEVATDAKTKLSKLTEGQYIFSLTVTDDDGAVSTDDVKVTVLPLPNKPPIANAGANQVIQIAQGTTAPITGTAQLDGSLSTDSDGIIVGYHWAKISGPNATIQFPDKDKTPVSGLSVGIYVFELTVTDDGGLTGTSQVIIIVTVKTSQRPVAIAGPGQVITLPQNSVVLDGSGSNDPDGTIKTILWEKMSGPAGEQFAPNQEKTTVTGLTEGTYVFRLTVTDNDGLADSSQVTVVVNRGEGEQKSCAPLSDIINLFGALQEVDNADAFKRFSEIVYGSYKEIQAFYKEVIDKNIAALPVSQQVDFFVEMKIASRLVVWIRNLMVIIQQDFEMRALALSMLNIHALLAYYIACIQTEDVNKARSPMSRALDILITGLNNITALLPNFSQQQKDILKKLLDISSAETSRVKNNGEKATKPLYDDMLRKIIDILTTMPL
ncbi:MAG: PKD domain-containing protein [Ferruginibacter sp.]